MAVPEDGPEFDAMLREIDADQQREEVSIPWRSMDALRRISLQYRISIPSGPTTIRMPPELQRYAKLSEAVHEWYREQYGERMKVDPSPGRTVLQLSNDLWVFRFPQVYGQVTFVCQRKFLPPQNPMSQAPVYCNVIQLIENMTEARAYRLSDEDLSYVWSSFQSGFEATDLLAQGSDHPLLESARGDVQTSVDCLTDPSGSRYGASKWASLQAAEKSMKAAVRASGAEFSHTHNLGKLVQALGSQGINLAKPHLIQSIQCTPGIRYGDEACNREQALAAHQATVELIVDLKRAGADFRHGMETFSQQYR